MDKDLKALEEFETTRELLDETEELLQFGSWTWDISSGTATWTAGLCALLEYPAAEMAKSSSLEFFLSHVTDESRIPLKAAIDRAIAERSGFSVEYGLRTRSGTVKQISAKGKVVQDRPGGGLKLLCINRDVTAMRNFEKEQERSIRELNRSNRDLEEFAYIASHDLQEPLRKISMFAERLRAKYANTLDDEGELFIARILASSANMRALIENLLDFSRVNRRLPALDRVDIRAVFEAAVSELELKIEEASAEIRFHGDFPTIQAAASEMKQLFGNILSNAIKFRKPTDSAHVDIRASKVSRTERTMLGLPGTQSYYRIEVKDKGIGFEPQYADRIFQIFQRLNSKAEYPGSGIGLAICKKIVEKHNGLIFADGTPGEGATITVILPETQS